ncbi:hypothetical protein KGY79_10110 [Candidatus Bipolaricaulota bacterium]|nr:hypothetical protein [Candidatus Bipolaricaulota bacterium]
MRQPKEPTIFIRIKIAPSVNTSPDENDSLSGRRCGAALMAAHAVGSTGGIERVNGPTVGE